MESPRHTSLITIDCPFGATGQCPTCGTVPEHVDIYAQELSEPPSPLSRPVSIDPPRTLRLRECGHYAGEVRLEFASPIIVTFTPPIRRAAIATPSG